MRMDARVQADAGRGWKGGVRSPGEELTGCTELTYGCQEPNLSTWQKLQALLTTEPSPRPMLIFNPLYI